MDVVVSTETVKLGDRKIHRGKSSGSNRQPEAAGGGGRFRWLVMYLTAVMLAVGVALLLSKLVFGAVSPWRDGGIAGALGFLGGFTREPLGDALMFAIIVSAMTALVFVFSPLPLLGKQIWLAVAAGACTGKLVMDGYAESSGP